MLFSYDLIYFIILFSSLVGAQKYIGQTWTQKEPGSVFAKGRSQGLSQGLNLLLLYWTFKLKPWLSHLVNSGPVDFLDI